MPQVASRGLQRPAIEVADDDPLHEHADQRRGQKTDRNRGQQIPVDRLRQIGAKDALHRPRRVGADHQQFAVRHVDDAHDAVGDRQTEGGEQQDRAEREAGEGAAEVVGPGEALLDGANRRPGRRAHRAVGLDPGFALLFGQRDQELADPRIAAFPEGAHCVKADAGVGRPEARLGMRELQALADLRILFARQRLVEQRQHLRVSAQRHLLGGLPAHRAFTRKQAQCGERGRQFAADAVVDVDRLARCRRRLDLGLACGIEHALAVDDDQALAGDRQRVVGERFQHRQRGFRRRLGERHDGRDPGLGVLGRERLEQRRVDRRVPARSGQQPATEQ
jgi:hypothetical protein